MTFVFPFIDTLCHEYDQLLGLGLQEAVWRVRIPPLGHSSGVDHRGDTSHLAAYICHLPGRADYKARAGESSDKGMPNLFVYRGHMSKIYNLHVSCTYASLIVSPLAKPLWSVDLLLCF